MFMGCEFAEWFLEVKTFTRCRDLKRQGYPALLIGAVAGPCYALQVMVDSVVDNMALLNTGTEPIIRSSPLGTLQQ